MLYQRRREVEGSGLSSTALGMRGWVPAQSTEGVRIAGKEVQGSPGNPRQTASCPPHRNGFRASVIHQEMGSSAVY